MDTNKNSPFFKCEPVYQYFLKLTNKLTDEFIKANFKEISFIVDPTNIGKLPTNMLALFADSFDIFCSPLIEEFQKEEQKIQVD